MNYQKTFQHWINAALIALTLAACETTQRQPVVVETLAEPDVCPAVPALIVIKPSELKYLKAETKRNMFENNVRIKGYIKELRTFCKPSEVRHE